MTAYPSVWWVFKLSPDTAYDPDTWAGLPAAGAADPSEKDEEAQDEEKKDGADAAEETADEPAEENGEDSGKAEEAPEAEKPEGTDAAERTGSDEASETVPAAEEAESPDVISTSYTSQSSGDMIFYNGQDEDTGYYTSFGADGGAGYY